MVLSMLLAARFEIGSVMADTIYCLGDLRLTPWRQLYGGGQPVAIGGKALDLLSVLAKADGNLVTKDELMAAVWPGVIVEENAIQVHISAARKALGTESGRLVTVHGRGYRLKVDHGADFPPPALPAQLPSVTVARFAHFVDDPTTHAFAAGLGEDIANALARIKSLTVRTDPRDAAEDPGPLADARARGACYRLGGSIDIADGRVCIRLNLIDTRDDTQLWGDKYDHRLDDRFALQDAVALRVAAAVEPAIEVIEARRIARSKADLMGSYDLYMQGWERVFSYDQTDLLDGIALMERAIALAPDFGLALAGAGISNHDVYVLGWGRDPLLHRQRAMAQLERALRVGEDDANVLAWVACGLPVLSGNVVRAAALIERALHANPSAANAWFASGYIQQCRGRFAEAIADYETAERFAPFGFNSSYPRLLIGSCHGGLGDFAKAIETIEAASHPGPWPDIYLAAFYAEAGHVEPALAALARLRALGVRPLAELAALFPAASRPTFPHAALAQIDREWAA